jgi:hypothetical protein
MGLCILGVKITHFIEDKNLKLHYYHKTLASLRKPYVLDGYEKSLLNEEKIEFLEYEECNSDYFMMSYSNFSGFKEDLSLRLFKKSASHIIQSSEFIPEGETYPSPLYHLINFADTEGYIGPCAVQAMAVELKKPKIRKKFCKDSFSRQLYKIIIETSKFKNGYLVFR